MMLVKSIAKFGDYCEFLWRSVGIPEKWREFLRNYRNEIYKLGIGYWLTMIGAIITFVGGIMPILKNKGIIKF